MRWSRNAPFSRWCPSCSGELAALEQEAQQHAAPFGPSRSRYRYVYELFAAALLYYTNKFGSNGLPQARNKLFAWAYALRVQMARVQFASIDNRARGKDDAAASPFVMMRNAVTGQAIQRLTVKVDKRDDAEHEKELQLSSTSQHTMSHNLLHPNCSPSANCLTMAVAVPIYQRNYAWRAPQIEQLISDIQDAVVRQESTYFLGNLVVTPRGIHARTSRSSTGSSG